ncbi:hypothetical protein ACFOPN_00810 [Xanthomonas hyacinthi]
MQLPAGKPGRFSSKRPGRWRPAPRALMAALIGAGDAAAGVAAATAPERR